MDGYYINYLTNSECYKNLSLTITDVNTQISNLSKLIDSFNGASGNNIEAIQTDLSGINNDLTNYLNRLTSIKNQLVNNANTFDKSLNEWKSKIGQNYSEPISAPGVFVNGDTNIIDYRTKYEIIEDVSVSANGYINVKVKSYIKSVEKNKEKNTSKSKILNIEYNTYEHGFDGDYI